MSRSHPYHCIINFARHKLLKFWAQSFLVGTPTIICGFRDDDGYVKSVQTFKTLDIPRMVRGKNGMWVRLHVDFHDHVAADLGLMLAPS